MLLSHFSRIILVWRIYKKKNMFTMAAWIETKILVGEHGCLMMVYNLFVFCFVWQPSNDGFYNCLDIWSTFLDYLFTKAKGRQAEIHGIIVR